MTTVLQADVPRPDFAGAFELIDTRLAVVVEAAAHALAAEARANVLAQRDPRRSLPSTLADSIQVASSDDGVVVRVSAAYGALVEYGSRLQRARPFLRPAIETVRVTFGERI